MLKQATVNQFQKSILPALVSGDYTIIDQQEKIERQRAIINCISGDVRYAEILLPRESLQMHVLNRYAQPEQQQLLDAEDHQQLAKDQQLLKQRMTRVEQPQSSVMMTEDYFDQQVAASRIDQVKTLNPFLQKMAKIAVDDNNWIPIIVFYDQVQRQVSILVSMLTTNIDGEHLYHERRHAPFTTDNVYGELSDHLFQSASLAEIITSDFANSIRVGQSVTGSWIVTDEQIISRLYDQMLAINQPAVSRHAQSMWNTYHTIGRHDDADFASDFYAFYPALDWVSTPLKFLPAKLIHINRQARTVKVAQLDKGDSLTAASILHQVCFNQPIDHELGSRFVYQQQLAKPRQTVDNKFALIPLANPRFTRQLAAADFIQKYNSLSLPEDFFDYHFQSQHDLPNLINDIKSGKLTISDQQLAAIPANVLNSLTDEFIRTTYSFSTELPNYSLRRQNDAAISDNHPDAVITQRMLIYSSTDWRNKAEHQMITSVTGYVTQQQLSQLVDELASMNYYVNVLSTESFNGYLRVYLQMSSTKLSTLLLPADADASHQNYQLPQSLNQLVVTNTRTGRDDQQSLMSDLNLSVTQVVSASLYEPLSSNNDETVTYNGNDMFTCNDFDSYSLEWFITAYYYADQIDNNQINLTTLKAQLRRADPDYYVVTYDHETSLMTWQADVLNKLIISSPMGRNQLESIK